MITRDHPEWPEFRRLALIEPIEALRTELENFALSAEQSAAIRGEIAARRRILALIEPEAPAAPAPGYAAHRADPTRI